MTPDYIVLDVECYIDYFLVNLYQPSTGKHLEKETYRGKDLDVKGLLSVLCKRLTVGFNSNEYDLPMIVAACSGYNCAQLKALSDRLIKGNEPGWMKLRSEGLDVPREWDHIDLINVAPGQSSLKIYAGRLHAAKMQDLPIQHNASISPEQRQVLRHYCANDVKNTDLLLQALSKDIALRETMSAEYGMDLRSKSDAQIAETVILSELRSATGLKYKTPTLPNGYSFRYKDPGVISFRTPTLQAIFEKILKTRFTLSDNGSVNMPEWLKAEKIEFDGAFYQMGIGGLHSCEKSQLVNATDDYLLFEQDVASYYPSIILQQRLAPAHLGESFLKVYGSIVSRRLAAKKSGDKATANTLKIAINGSFGKLGSKYSALYSPDLLIQTTVTGQLALLMLIERMAAHGIKAVSANTDGAVFLCHKSKEQTMEEEAFDWMLDTSYELERTDYKTLASRDVNNYLAIKTDGSVKGKGCFAIGGLMKNPDGQIVYKAVAEAIASGVPVEKTIKDCNDIRDFVTIRNVTGGAVWQDQELGKAVRFYYSTSVPEAEPIRYLKNNNMVPKSAGARPLMDLPGSFPNDIDYPRYIVAAEKLLCEVGYVRA
ncbi:MAG: hypothetical protein IBX55_17080 [Methyloprofundus sp.]|nr:hypothetical protein [Methyloprofundus sp.]